MAKKKQKTKNTGEVRCFWKNLMLYLALLIACFSYALNYGGFFPYTLLYLTLFLPVMNLFHLLITAKMLRMSERLNSRIFIKGETVNYRFTLNNTSCFYMPYIDIHMHTETRIIFEGLKDVRVSVAPFSVRQIKYDFPLALRGKYSIGVERVRIHDLMGLFTFTFHPREKKYILVKPRILNRGYNIIPDSHAYEGQQNLESRKHGNDELSDIRKYVYGDSLKKIHWKLSAKLDKTMVRETFSEPDNSAVIFFNLNSTLYKDNSELMDKDTLLKEDCLIEELVAEINHLFKNHIPIKLLFNKDSLNCMSISSLAEFNSTYEYLSELNFNHLEHNSKDLDFSNSMEGDGSLKYIFTLTLDGDMVDEILKLSNKGANVTLYYIDYKSDDDKSEEDMFEKIQEVFEKSGIRAVRLEPCMDWLESQQFDMQDKPA